MKKLIALFMVAVLCLSLCACSSNKIKSIVLSENSIDITVGDSYSLSVIVLPEDSDEAITWQSANEDIATVDDSGTVRSVSVGITSIVVSSQSGISSNCTVNVIDKSAYDKLNDNEKAFVDTFVRKAIGYFKAPDSVSIRKIDEYEGDASTGALFG